MMMTSEKCRPRNAIGRVRPTLSPYQATSGRFATHPIQELCRRFAPETNSLRLVHEVDNDAIDYSNSVLHRLPE
jgi:hypothetical protein